MAESWFPLLCYLLVFTDLLSADLPCKLLKRVPGLLGGHITPKSILGRYHNYLPSPPQPSSPPPPPRSWFLTNIVYNIFSGNEWFSKTDVSNFQNLLTVLFAAHISCLTAYSIWVSVSTQSSSRMPIFLLAYQQCVMKVGTSWFLYPAVKRIFLFFFIFVLFHFIFLGRFVFSFSVPMKRFSAMMRHDGNRDYWCFITQKVFQN